jgi:hypothetical protein
MGAPATPHPGAVRSAKIDTIFAEKSRTVIEVLQLFDSVVESVNISLSPGKRQRFLNWIRVT